MTSENAELAELANRHLWGQFSSLGRSVDGMTVIERGEGCYVWDTEGKRYLDGLAGLYDPGGLRTAQPRCRSGRSGRDPGLLPDLDLRHPAAVQLAARLASLAPGDLNRVFFTSGGSEAVESAWKLARQYFKVKGEPLQPGDRSHLSYHGVTMGALSITALPR